MFLSLKWTKNIASYDKNKNVRKKTTGQIMKTKLKHPQCNLETFTSRGKEFRRIN